MHRVDSSGSIAGAFSNGDPAQGVPGTRLEEDWLNAVQEELCAVVETCGGTLVKGTHDQVISQCVSAATANKIMRRDAAGRAKVADGSAADDIATKGQVDAAVTPASGTLTRGTGWSEETTGSFGTVVKKSAGIVTAIFTELNAGSGSFNSVFTLPSGYRPSKLMTFPGWIKSGANDRPAVYFIDTNGILGVYRVLSGDYYVSSPYPSVANGDRAYGSVSFHV